MKETADVTATPTSAVRLRQEDVLFFNRQLASMARLNMPIAKGLRILARDVKDPEFKRVIEGVQQDLDEGLTLQEALAKYPGTFSGLQLEIIRAGETTGNLAVILEELNAHTESMQRIKGRIVEAITYPAVIAVVILCFLLFFLVVLAPQFEDMLLKRPAGATEVQVEAAGNPERQAWDELPGLTRFVFSVSHFVNWGAPVRPILLLFLIGIVLLAVWVLRKVYRMGEQYDDVLFRVPLFGKLFERAALMKITRTMRDLLSNGVSMVETLRLTAPTVGRNRIQRKLDELRMAVEEGGAFSRNLAGGDVFPDTMVWKLQMAEEKGIVEEALVELAAEFEVAVDKQTTLITKLLAPLMLVAMGGIVFLMFIACFVPLTNLYGGR